MSRELHYRPKDNKYALYSTIVEDYIVKWDTWANIREFWVQEKVNKAISEVDEYMREIDKVVD